MQDLVLPVTIIITGIWVELIRTAMTDKKEKSLSSVLYLVRLRSLGHKAPSMEVDEQPGGARLFLYPGQMGGDGGRLSTGQN